MSDYVETSEPITTAAGTFRVCVHSDPDGVNPRADFDQLGTMVCPRNTHYAWPREGDLVDKIEDAFDRGGARLAVRYLTAVHGAVVLPIYGGGDYDRMRTGEFGAEVDNDARATGVIYALRADITAGWVGSPMPTDAEIAGWLTGEVEDYVAWAHGEMAGYVIEQTLGCTHDTDCDQEHCWREAESCWGYFSVSEALEQGRLAVPTETDEFFDHTYAGGRDRYSDGGGEGGLAVPTETDSTDAEWLAQMFEFDVCDECGWNADRHTVGSDPLGLRHAYCADPIPDDLSDDAAAAAAELARRVELSTTTHPYISAQVASAIGAEPGDVAAGLIAESESGEIAALFEPLTVVSVDAQGRRSRVFETSVGRKFAVRILATGQRYGATESLTADGPMIEFFDHTYAGEAFGPLGQFVSRYYVDTVLGRDRYSDGGGEGGLTLQGGIAEWSIDSQTMSVIRGWVRETGGETGRAVHTWANGYGLWQARVPATDDAATVAKAAIMRELRQREGDVSESRVQLRLVETGHDDTVVYGEADDSGTEPPQSYTMAQVAAAINSAVSDITGAVDLPETGTVDALNLLTNAALSYLDGTAQDLSDVVAVNYSADLPTVLGWIEGD